MESFERFKTLSDKALLRLRSSVADECVRIMNMPVAERRAVTGKGGTAEQGGTMSAMFVIMLDREVQRRGLEPAEAALAL